MKILFVINASHPEPLNHIRYDELDEELGAEMIVRTAHAMRFIADDLMDQDASAIQEITSATITVYAPGLAPAIVDLPADFGEIEWSLTLVEPMTLTSPEVEVMCEVCNVNGAGMYQTWSL